MFLIVKEYTVPRRQIDYARTITRFSRILRDPYELPPGIPEDEIKYHAALRDLVRRWARLVPAEQVLRLRTGIEESFMATACEVLYRSRNVLPSVDELITLRESSECSACFVVTEMTGLSPLPGHLVSDPRLERIARTARRVIAWTNDILSGPRELRRPGAIDLISALAEEHGISDQEALDLAVETHIRETQTFIELSQRELHRDSDPRVAHYITGIGQYIRGSLDWNKTTSHDNTAQTPS